MAPLARQFPWTLFEKMLAVAAHSLVDSGTAQARGAAEALLFRIGPLMLFSSPWFSTTFVGPRAIYEVRLVIKPGGKLPIRTASFETMDSYLASFLPEAARIEFSPLLIANGNSGSAKRWRFQTQRAHHGAALR